MYMNSCCSVGVCHYLSGVRSLCFPSQYCSPGWGAMPCRHTAQIHAHHSRKLSVCVRERKTENHTGCTLPFFTLSHVNSKLIIFFLYLFFEFFFLHYFTDWRGRSRSGLRSLGPLTWDLTWPAFFLEPLTWDRHLRPAGLGHGLFFSFPILFSIYIYIHAHTHTVVLPLIVIWEGDYIPIPNHIVHCISKVLVCDWRSLCLHTTLDQIFENLFPLLNNDSSDTVCVRFLVGISSPKSVFFLKHWLFCFSCQFLRFSD
jgi:hypothetical protein